MIQKIASKTIEILYSGLFLYTGICKLADYAVFKEQIATSPILAPIAPAIARCLPWLEIALAILIILPIWKIKTLALSLILMTTFTIYITLMLLFTDQPICSCGGIIESMSWEDHLLFNGLFIIFAIIGIILQKRARKSEMQVLNSLITQ